MLQQVQLALARAGELGQALEALLDRRPALEGIRAGPQPQDLLGSAEVVEDLHLGGRQRELAVLVLPVERHQRATERAHLPDRTRAAVKVTPRAAVAARG